MCVTVCVYLTPFGVSTRSLQYLVVLRVTELPAAMVVYVSDQGMIASKVRELHCPEPSILVSRKKCENMFIYFHNNITRKS